MCILAGDVSVLCTFVHSLRRAQHFANNSNTDAGNHKTEHVTNLYTYDIRSRAFRNTHFFETYETVFEVQKVKKETIHTRCRSLFFHRVSVCNVALWYGNKTSIISHILADGDECLQVRLCNVPCMMHICNGTWCWLAVLWVSFCHYLKQTTYGRCGHRTNVRDGREWSKKKQRNKMSEMATPEK